MKYLVTPFDITKYDNIDCGFILSIKSYAAKGASFFTSKQINEISSKYKNREIFLNFTKMFTDKEINSLKQYIKKINFENIDGILIGDIGLYYVFLKHNLENKLIYFPDTIITNTVEFNFFKKLNFLGCQIAKELTLDEILNISSKKLLKTFLIGHGYLSMFYSKRKLLTNFNKYYDKNYNLKYNYNLSAKEPSRKDLNFPILEDMAGTYLYRPYVLHSFNVLDQLKNSIDYFIIDGIFHNDEYIIDVLGQYQNNNFDIENIEKKYEEKLDTGFYYEKTIYKL